MNQVVQVAPAMTFGPVQSHEVHFWYWRSTREEWAVNVTMVVGGLWITQGFP